MLIVPALVIALSFVLASAQSEPTVAPSPECITAYNATYNSGDTSDCVAASLALFLGTATDEQRMMVCSAGQQCNTMIENVISLCGNTVGILFYLASG